MHQRFIHLLARLFVCLGLTLATFTSHSAASGQTDLTGWVHIVWGDGPMGANSSEMHYWLIDALGRATRLQLAPQVQAATGGGLQLDRQYVRFTGSWLAGLASGGGAVFDVQTATALEGSLGPVAPQAVTGSQAYISILCKFADYSDEPQPLSYFENMYGEDYPLLGHYWREQSYNLANIAGSLAVGWFDLPQPRSYYVYDQDGNGTLELDFGSIARDCTATADPIVDYTNFVGINLMFNSELNGFAWGGGWTLLLDGTMRRWNMTWEPPWGWGNLTVMGHEMGHSFGLPHSSGQYGQVYDNPWDVMSDTWSNCDQSNDATYQCLGQHTIAYHKDRLGWIPVAQKVSLQPGSQQTLMLEQLALPQSPAYRMAEARHCTGSLYYTVEVRQLAGYDVKLPSAAVIIHEIVNTRGEPAHIIDADGNGNSGDAGARWLPGESFADAANGITVTVNALTATGANVTITNSPPTVCVPEAPTLVAPSNGQMLRLRSVGLRWQSSNSTGETGFGLRVNTDDDPDAQPWIVDQSPLTGSTYTVTVPSDGRYYWHMRTHNAWGQTSNWATRSFIADTEVPTATFISPLPNGYINNDPARLEMTAADNLSGIVGVTFYIGFNNGSQWGWHQTFYDNSPAEGWSWAWNNSTLTDQRGMAVYAWVWDGAGNAGSVGAYNITLDRTPPTSGMTPLAAHSLHRFPVSWTGSDAIAGIAAYDVQYRDGDSGAWLDWQTGVTTLTAQFVGESNHTYHFRSRAHDRAANVEAWPDVADTQTTVIPQYDIFLPLLVR